MDPNDAAGTAGHAGSTLRPQPGAWDSQFRKGRWHDRDPLRVLLVEDNLPDARYVRALLDEAWYGPIELLHVVRLADAYEPLAAGVECVLLDLRLPDAVGLETILQTRAAAPSTPVIVLSGVADEGLAVETIDRGAQDFLVKDQVDGQSLARAIRFALRRKRAEQALLGREELCRAVLDALPANIAVLDADGSVVAVNQSWALRTADCKAELPHCAVGDNYLGLCAAAGSVPVAEGSTGVAAAEAVRAGAGIRLVLAGLMQEFRMTYALDRGRSVTMHVWPLPGSPTGAVIAIST
jgi:FixJ family two-component response regulator